MKKIFANQTLNMKKIKYIGLDMDHTLVEYNSKNFEKLAFEITSQKLVDILNYPKEVLNLKFDFNRAIRGLVIDKPGGNLLKLSQFGVVKHIQHGFKTINYKDQKKSFENKQIDLGHPNYYSIDTDFSISFATLFSELIRLKDETKSSKFPEYMKIAEDIDFALDLAHKDNSLKKIVTKDLDKFIIKNPTIVNQIKTYKKHGKKIFIITNSDFEYTKVLLDFAISPFLDKNESWVDLFEYVITSARKPRFFFDDLNFLRIDPNNGTMTNIEDHLKPGTYQGGCSKRFADELNINPNQILYIGDHIYGDILRMKKECSWKAGLVIKELGEEIQNNIKAEPIFNELKECLALKVPKEKEINQLISEQIELSNHKNQSDIDELMNEVSKLDIQMTELIKKEKSFYNPHWGPVMRAGFEESYFAHQAERFSDIYMSELSDFFNESPRSYYRSHKRLMAHDLDME